MRALSLMVLVMAASCTFDYGTLKGKAGAGDGGLDAPLPLPDTGVPPGTGGSTGTGVGGVSGSGGIVASGGVFATGGTHGTGGTIGTGGIGTIPGSGGVIGAGGIAGTGGAVASGGTIATGGKIGSGGTIGTGGVAATGGALGTGGIGTGGVAASGGTLGTGGTGVCRGPLPANYGQSCGFCGGTITCDASCTRSDTSCAPTGGNVQFRNELVMSTDVPPADHVLDAYSGAPFNAFINTNCCSGGMWTVTAIATGGYLITNHAYTDSSGSHLALQAVVNGSGYGLELGSVPNNATSPTPAQAWTFTALAGGKFRLTNAALGPGWSLSAPPDIATWNYALMDATADVPAQRWVVSANP